MTNSSRKINMCNYIRFPEETFTIPPNQQEQIVGKFNLLTPINSSIGDEYFLNVVALASDGKKYSSLSVSARVNLLGLFFKWSHVPLQGEKAEAEKVSYPVAGVSIIVSLLLFVATIIIFKRYNVNISAFFISLGMFFVVFILLMFLL